MARLRKSSAILETARKRLTGLKSITPPPNFGAKLTITAYEVKIEAVDAKLTTYNQTLATADQLLSEFKSEEAQLNDLNHRHLAATAAYYGPDSDEYEMVGGTRTSVRKRRPRKSKTAGS